MRELALFAGAGGGILGGRLLGWRTVCAVEFDEYARAVLMCRQDDGSLEPFPIWDDVRTFDGRPWRGRVDVVSGGFPCQDISTAGKGAGISGERSGLWREMARIICEVRPRFVFVENSPALVVRGLGVVLGDLAALGYDAEWGVLGAADIGAPHQRDRIWIVGHLADAACNRIESAERLTDASGSLRHAMVISQQGQGATAHVGDANCIRCSRANERRPVSDKHGHDSRKELGRLDEQSRTGCTGSVGDADGLRQLQPQRRKRIKWRRSSNAGQGARVVAYSNRAQRERGRISSRVHAKHADPCGARWWGAEPGLGRVADGVAHRVDRLKCIGNGQVPQAASEAFAQLARRGGWL